MAEETLRIHVSPQGAAAADGSPEQPLDLEAAQARVRELRAQKPEAEIEVRLAGGVYRREQPLTLTAADSGRRGHPVRWVAQPGETAVISGGEPVEGWQRLDHEVPGLPEAARERVWYTSVTGPMFRALFDATGLLTRATVGPLSSDAPRNEEATPTKLLARPEDLRAWPNVTDLELFIKPSHVWEAQYLPVASIDATTGEVHTTAAGSYSLIADGKKNPPRQYWLENVPEGLSEPGRWLLDSVAGRLYLWPRDHAEPVGVLRPRLSEVVHFTDGQGDGEGEPCHDVAFEGVTFAHGDRLPWPEPRRAAQHDWQIYHWPDALMRFCGARDIVVRRCRFEHSGGSGLRMDGFAVGNLIERCDFAGLGGNAIALVGDEPATQREWTHHNDLLANRIRDCGRLWWQASGILINQASHNHVADNHLSELPYCGITLISGREGAFGEGERLRNDGRDGHVVDEHTFGESPREFPFVIGHLTCRHNVVEHNELHDVMQRMGDGNGIYLSGTGWGNIVRGNYVHDIPASGVHSAIRLDDMQWYARIEQNVICRVNGAGLTLKDINDLTDNVVVDCHAPAALLVRRAPMWGANIKRNIVLLHSPGVSNDDGFAPFYGGGGFGGRVDQPNFDDNLLWCMSEPSLAERALTSMREHGRERHSRAGDPGFVDAAKDDYRLRPDSAAFDLGIRSLVQWGPRRPVGSDSG